MLLRMVVMLKVQLKIILTWGQRHERKMKKLE